MHAALIIFAALAVGSHDLIGPSNNLIAPSNDLIGHVPLERPIKIIVPVTPEITLPGVLEVLWPANVRRLRGLRVFRSTRYSQRLDGTTNTMLPIRQAIVVQGTMQPNPNAVFPWIVQGGLHNSTGWEAVHAASIPGPVKIWVEHTPAPRYRWAFPEGTTFLDLLSKDGRPFELRTSMKVDGKWKMVSEFRDLDAAPRNFHGAGKSCTSCHTEAGKIMPPYGMALRGDDNVFSWTPFEDGTFRRRTDVEFEDSAPMRKLVEAMLFQALPTVASAPLPLMIQVAPMAVRTPPVIVRAPAQSAKVCRS